MLTNIYGKNHGSKNKLEVYSFIGLKFLVSLVFFNPWLAGVCEYVCVCMYIHIVKFLKQFLRGGLRRELNSDPLT